MFVLVGSIASARFIGACPLVTAGGGRCVQRGAGFPPVLKKKPPPRLAEAVFTTPTAIVPPGPTVSLIVVWAPAPIVPAPFAAVNTAVQVAPPAVLRSTPVWAKVR